VLEEADETAAAHAVLAEGLELFRAEREEGRFRSGEEGRGGQEQEEEN
jgi:hypothetical protein